LTQRQQRREPPRDVEEAAAFKGLGHAVTLIRERKGMDRDEFAAEAEMSPAELEQVEHGELDEWWGGLRMIAKAAGMPLSTLVSEAEKSSPGNGGESERECRGG
jgi:transcriptional regulator with XRE-family HTH domain